MKGLEVGATLVRLTDGYFRIGDRLRVTSFAQKNKWCYAVIDEPGYSYPYRIDLPLNETDWDVDYTAGPDQESESEWISPEDFAKGMEQVSSAFQALQREREEAKAALTTAVADDRRKILAALAELTKPTQSGRYAEKGYNDDFNDGLNAAIDYIEELD